MEQYKILVSAYACEPGAGSEPGVGWEVVRILARVHKVWVITRSNNRPLIEQQLVLEPIPTLSIVYLDLPSWARWWKRGQCGVQIYYYLWQIGALVSAWRLLRDVDFDVMQHVTFAKYWAPSFIALLPRPFIWGPVGGGESVPSAFRRDFGVRGRVYESLRDVARWIGEHDPFVRLTARRSVLALAATEETGVRLRALGASDVRHFSQVGISTTDVDSLATLATSAPDTDRFISIGRLLHWKGFHLGLRAFAQVQESSWEYWIVGDGPERGRLERLARALGVSNRVTFWGELPRRDVLRKLMESAVLVHPSLHESGGIVCTEAMACGRPVVCLNLGGPAMQVTEKVGFKVPARDPLSAVQGLASAMSSVAGDPAMRLRKGNAARTLVRERLRWDRKGNELQKFVKDAVVRARSTHSVKGE